MIGIALPACDRVWGLTGEPSPCELSRFDGAPPIDLLVADDASVSIDRGIVVFTVDGAPFESSIDHDVDVSSSFGLNVFPISSLGIAPEGDFLFYSAGAEPAIRIANLEAGVWRPASGVPPTGIAAGTPSSAEFGPRRVFVRERNASSEVQEYVEDGDGWRPTGDPLALESTPNLSASGLTMVFAVNEPGGAGVYAANRDSLASAFRAPREVFRSTAAELEPQLTGTRCDSLIVREDRVLRQYDRQ